MRGIVGTLLVRVPADLFNLKREEGLRPMGFRPLHDRVLVRRVEAEAKTAGGIIIPDTAQEKPQEGEVVSVGSGARTDDGKITPPDVKRSEEHTSELQSRFDLVCRLL